MSRKDNGGSPSGKQISTLLLGIVVVMFSYAFIYLQNNYDLTSMNYDAVYKAGFYSYQVVEFFVSLLKTLENIINFIFTFIVDFLVGFIDKVVSWFN